MDSQKDGSTDRYKHEQSKSGNTNDFIYFNFFAISSNQISIIFQIPQEGCKTGNQTQTPLVLCTYTVFKPVQVRPVSGEGVMLCVCPTSRGQCRDEDRLQRDEDLAEGRLFHQPFQLLKVDAHAEGGAVTVHLKQ